MSIDGNGQHHARAGVPGAGRFIAQPNSAADVTLTTVEVPFADIDEALPTEVRTLASTLATVYTCTADRRAPWLAGETFSCDGGAVAAQLVAERLGLDSTLHVGLYWHTDPTTRAEIIGYDLDTMGEDDWDAVEQAMDEHHHWTSIRLPDGTEYVIDPNGPVRGEPHIQRATGLTGTRYQHGAPYLVYDPDDGADAIAADMYPGLIEQVAAAL